MDNPLDLKLLMNQSTVSVTPISTNTIVTNTTKIYKCETCSATYSDKMHFDLHKQTHQKEMPMVQILMNPATAHQVIPQPSPAHQGATQIVIQEDQLATYKRAYGVDPQQLYTLAPVTQYQVITANNRNGTQSLANQVNIPTYVVAAMGDGHHQLHAIQESIIQHDQSQVQQQHHHQQQEQHQQEHQQEHQQHQSSQLVQQRHSQQQQQQNQEQGQLVIQVPSQGIEVSSGNNIRLGRNIISQKDRPYKCDQCTASFIEPNELEEHKKKHTGDGPFTCEDCHFTFMYKSHFKSHKTRCLKKRALMANPPKTIVTGPQVKRQFPTNHMQQFSQKHQVQQHHQQLQQQQQQQQLQNHQQIHHNSNHQLQEQHQLIQSNHQGLGKTYISTVNNKGHVSRQSIAKNTSQTRFNPSNPSFKRIKKESRIDRPYECDECDASFQNDMDLKNHKSKHTGDGPFTCNECRFVFLFRKLYEAHRRRCEKKRKAAGFVSVSQTSNTLENNIDSENIINNPTNMENENATTVGTMVIAQTPQITHVQSLQQQHHQQQQQQELNLQAGQTIATALPASSLPSAVLSGALQMHPVHGQHAIIEMRPNNSQSQELQHMPIHPLIEQVLVGPGGTTMSALGGNRSEFKYEVVPVSTALSELPDGSVNQIMGLIKVKNPNQ